MAISDPILEEIEEIPYEKFEWLMYRVRQAIADINSFTYHVHPLSTLSVFKNDPDDDRILERAILEGQTRSCQGTNTCFDSGE